MVQGHLDAWFRGDHATKLATNLPRIYPTAPGPQLPRKARQVYSYGISKQVESQFLLVAATTITWLAKRAVVIVPSFFSGIIILALL